MPAPRATATSAPSALSFFTVYGVAATRGSPASVSRATAIRIPASPIGRANPLVRKSGERENQEANDEGDIARRFRPAGKAGYQAKNGNDENRQREKPVTHDTADGEAEQQINDVDEAHEREQNETVIGRFMRGVVVAGGGGVFDGAVIGHGGMSPGDWAGCRRVTAIGAAGQRPALHAPVDSSRPAAASACACRAATRATEKSSIASLNN